MRQEIIGPGDGKGRGENLLLQVILRLRLERFWGKGFPVEVELFIRWEIRVQNGLIGDFGSWIA